MECGTKGKGGRTEDRPVMRYSTALSGLLNAARIAFAT